MRLNISCAVTDTEFQNRIFLHDNTLNLQVVVRQPHLDPNWLGMRHTHTAGLLAVALRGSTRIVLGLKRG